MIREPACLADAIESHLLPVYFGEQRSAAIEPIDVNAGSKTQAIDSKVRPVRITDNLPWIEFRAQEPGVLAGPGKRPLHEKRRQVHSARNAIIAWSQETATGRVTWPIVARCNLVKESARLLRAG